MLSDGLGNKILDNKNPSLTLLFGVRLGFGVYENSEKCLWHGVVATAAPRVATQNAAHGEPQSFDWSVFAKGFDSIL